MADSVESSAPRGLFRGNGPYIAGFLFASIALLICLTISGKFAMMLAMVAVGLAVVPIMIRHPEISLYAYAFMLCLDGVATIPGVGVLSTLIGFSLGGLYLLEY